jgi:uncharacterized YigZ family protein
MTDEYQTIKTGGEGFYSEKRSKFLAFAHHVETVDEVKRLLDGYRKKYYDARHVCYAYMLGADRVEFRANDDGEPSSTAGKPILGQINSCELTDTLIVVVRYYGGVNLGTSGLIVAYREAAADAIVHSEVEIRQVEETVTYSFAYPMMNDVMRIVKEMSPRIVSQTFDNTCEIKMAIRHSEADQLRQRLAKLSFVMFFFLLSITASAQMKWNQRYQQYIDQYKDIAIEQMLRWKVPASITLAQGIFESGAGQSDLTRRSNNHFGIKCHGWKGSTVYKDDDTANECFRAYDTAFDSFEDHSRFLATGQRYRSLFSLKITDYKGWAKGLKAAGYATNPKYANQLIELIQLYKLYEYDKAKSYDKFMTQHAKDRRINGQWLHPIKIYNKNYYLQARRGDTFRSIGDEIGISYKKIAKYNERDRRDQLTEGEIIWLKKKQKRAPKEYKDHRHYVRHGESMYSIAQKYGIRLKSLYKMNHMKPDDDIHVGDALRLR